MRISATSAAAVAKFVEAIIDEKLLRAVAVAPGLCGAFDEIAPKPGGWSGATFDELVRQFERLADDGEVNVVRDFMTPLESAAAAISRALAK